MNFVSILYFIAGLIVITIGAEILLKGASKIASLLGIRPIIIGLTVVSIGTSLPELAVGITAIKEGAEDMAIGNIAGTNLVNILLILGLSAAIRPLPLNLKSMKLEVWIMIITSILLLALCLDGHLSFWEGLLLVVLGIVYIGLLIKYSKKESPEMQKEFREEYEPSTPKEQADWKSWLWNAMLLISGIVSTIYGADLLVSGAVDIARGLGWSEAIIGLTIVAIGTSAPELVTTLVATYKNDRDVAIGNLVGSSITNVLFILGITCMSTVNGVQVSNDILWFDLPLGAAVAIACYPVFKSDNMVSRKEGITFVVLYLVYLSVLLFVRS